MSQLDTLSKPMGESLRNLADRLAKVKEEKEAGAESAKEAQLKEETGAIREFFDGLVSKWYESLNESSREGVRTLFAKLNEHGSEEVLELMSRENVPSPFNLISEFFVPDKKVDETLPGNQ
jgi:hypothetical protein